MHGRPVPRNTVDEGDSPAGVMLEASRRGLLDASRRGLRLDPRLPYDTWRALGSRIKVRSDASSWWLGDWLVFGGHHYGDRWTAASELTGLDDRLLQNFAIVARRFQFSRRREDLSFQHHADVCAMPDAAQEHWLDLAERNGWSKAELRLRIRDAGRSGPGRRDGEVLRLSLKVEPSRERSWREASARSGRCLEEWIADVLDAAASG